MNEKELRVVFNITPDPEINKVDISSEQIKNEIKSIVNIFSINNSQQSLPFKRIRALESVLSYN